MLWDLLLMGTFGFIDSVSASSDLPSSQSMLAAITSVSDSTEKVGRTLQSLRKTFANTR